MSENTPEIGGEPKRKPIVERIIDATHQTEPTVWGATFTALGHMLLRLRHRRPETNPNPPQNNPEK